MARKVHESHYQNFPHMFRGGLPDALEFGDLTSFDEEPLIGATSRKQFFGGFCRCVNCLHSVSNESLKLPCWYRSRDADGFIVKRILLNDVVHSQDPERKEASIMLFNWLTKDNHGAYGSDLKHLGSISPSELVSLLSSLSLSPLSKNLLALLRLLFVISWKIDPGDCEKAINLERGKFLKELGKKITFDEFKSALHGIRERLQMVASKLLGPTLRPNTPLEDLVQIHYRSHTIILEIFDLPNNQFFPWVHWYMFNFRNILASIWENGVKGYLPVNIQLPKNNDGKGPALPDQLDLMKKSSCKICKKKFTKRSNSLFGLEFVHSPEMHIFPRQALFLDRRFADWINKPDKSLESYPRSIVIVCQPMCLLQLERAKYPKLNVFLDRFLNTKLYQEILTWTDKKLHMIPLPEQFTELNDEIPTVKKLLGILDAIEIQALVNNSLPLQFRTISPRSYLGLDHNQPLEDKSDDDDDYGDSAGSYCNHHLHHHRNHHQHHHEQHSKHHKYANHRAANIPLDDDSDADDDDEESSCSSSSASEKKEALKKIQNNPFHPIDFNQAFTSSPQVKHALMTEYKELLIQAVKDESKDEHSAKVATVTCQWSKTWGVFHEFAGKNLKLNFHVEMSGKLQPFQPLSPKDLFDSIQYCFRSSFQAIFPVDSSFLDLKLFLNGVKFNAIPESREMNKKMDELLRKHDYLMFFQNFDLFEKSCDGGIIFRADKNIFVGVIITGMFDFLMDDVDSSDFLLDYNSYHMSHYNIAKVDRPREMKNPQIILKGSKNELHSKVFAIIRVVALRMYFKQTNSGLFTFPLKWYRIMIILPMKNWDNEKSYVVTLYAVLKDDKKVGPTIASFVDSLGSSVEDFKFVRMKGKTSVTLDLDEPLTDKMESVSSGSNTRCIVINASLRDSSELENFTVGCSVPKLTFYDNPSLCRLVLRIEIKGKKSAVQHLLIQTNQPICKILEGAWKNMEFLKCPFITKGFSLIVLDSSEYSFRPRYPASPEETASQISEKTGLSGRDLTLLWTNDEVHTDDLFNPKKDFFKECGSPCNRVLLDDKHFFDKPHRLVYHGTLITSFNNNIRSGHPTAEIGVVFGVCPERCKGECDSDDYAKITKTWGQKLPALVIKENKQLKLLASNRDLFEDSLLLCVSFTPFRGSPGSSDIFDDKTDNIKEILELCAIEERIQIFLIPFEIDGLGTYMILSHYKASNRCELTIPKDFKKANSILKQLKVDYTVPKIPRHFSFERNTKTYVHGLFFASISRFPLAFMIRSSHHMSVFRQIFPSTPSKDFSHHLKPLELAFPPDPESLFAWDPERTFKIDLLGADDSDRTTCLKKAFRDGRHYVVSLNLLTGLSFPEFYGSYPIFFMKGDGVNFEGFALSEKQRILFGKHVERFGPIQEMEIEKQAVWRRNYDQRDWRKLRELQSFQEKTRHINAIYQKKQGENRETAKPVAQIQPPPFSIKMKFSLENGFRLADDAFAHFLPTAAQLGAPTASNAKALAPLQDECRLDFASLTSEFGDEAGHQALEVTYKEVVEQMRAEALKNDDYISPRQCAFCNKEGFDFSVCTKCKVTVYCSLKCQKDNHRNHDRECQNIVETRMKEIVKNVKIPNCRENRAKKATTNGRKKNGKKR